MTPSLAPLPKRRVALLARELFMAVNTSPRDFVPVKPFQMVRFDGSALGLMVSRE